MSPITQHPASPARRPVKSRPAVGFRSPVPALWYLFVALTTGLAVVGGFLALLAALLTTGHPLAFVGVWLVGFPVLVAPIPVAGRATRWLVRRYPRLAGRVEVRVQVRADDRVRSPAVLRN